jgi:hypothetical protein
MKHLVAIIFGVGILFQTLSTGIIFLNFQIQKDFISKNLCAKKTVNNNSCKGSCHLKKQLKENESKEPSPAGTLKELKEAQMFCQPITSFGFQPILPINEEFIRFSVTYASLNATSVFHPPQV